MSGQYRCPYCESPNLSTKGRICNNCQTIFPSGTQLRRANVGRISNKKSKGYFRAMPPVGGTDHSTMDPLG